MNSKIFCLRKFRQPTFAAAILLVILSACSPRTGQVDPGRDIGQRLVEVEPAHQQCKVAEDCVLVYVDCSGCGCGVAVNSRFEAEYRTRYESICSSYSGAVCEVLCPELELLCLSGNCTAEPVK